MTSIPAATRDEALARLDAFAPRAGRSYAATRNTDFGPGRASGTSVLSPYLRRRMILEQEVVERARDAHGAAAEKFVSEVFWRTYFKGHLETRPSIWTDYRDRAAAGLAQLDTDASLREAYAHATTGRTGIDCFDDWARALVAGNWLHNHVRMWFASIWIFTLRLPWPLGAEFFMRHLLDGDPASNTLSWRWVAGLHTRGKHYVARAENIRRYTEGRYDPAGLDEHPAPLDEPEPPPPRALPRADAPAEGDVALLLHLDDLMPESLNLGAARVVRVAGLLAPAERAADPVRSFDRAAMADALARASAHFRCTVADPDPGWAAGLPVVAAYAPVGPSADALPPCFRVRRAWDEATWPQATRGFFKVREAIPRLLASL